MYKTSYVGGLNMATKGETTNPTSSNFPHNVSRWQAKWFVLETKTSKISYYTSKESLTKGITTGHISLQTAKVMADERDDVTFYVNSQGRQFKFQAQDNKEREKWMHAIDVAIHHQTGKNDTKLKITSNGDTNSPTKLIGELKTTVGDNLEPPDSPEEFYDAMSTPFISFSQVDSSSMSDYSYTPSPQPMESNLLGSSHPPRRANSTMSIAKGLHGKEQRRASVLSDTAKFEEEEFVPSHITMVSVLSRQQSPDVMDDDYEEEADLAETVNDHKSIILHVLSQLRPGVDLTRITLPAFILERRSHLEVTADMFGHADYFARIPLYSDPKKRLIEAVRFFVSTLSSGRKGTLAKKPYNPILGELFQCYYDVPEDVVPLSEVNEVEENIVKKGPIPWANYSSLTFVSEQVSHHPPISAFYAECPATGIYVIGYAQVKSKFMGLSVQVQNLGLISVNIPKYNEEYRVTLPNAYGRSILTVPWMEIAGKVVLSCQQTNYHATLEFHQKPFYGGRKHRFTSELFGPKQKKPFMKLEGEWNNVIYSKVPGEEQTVFFDAQKTPVYKKKMKTMEVMEANESRKVWRHVTSALKEGNEQAAADAKHEVEEAQREKAKYRKERGIEWVPKHFKLLEDGRWVYENTLERRNPDLKK
jgi:hypothetical protein